jgi:hypothetical protein
MIAHMPTPTKRPATKSSKPAKTAAAEDEAAAAQKPSLRFHFTAKLRNKLLQVLGTVEAAEDPKAHRAALTDVILELVEAGLEYYFLDSLKAAKASFVTQQSAALGLLGVQRVMGPVIRNIVGRMDGPQLQSLCGSIRHFME